MSPARRVARLQAFVRLRADPVRRCAVLLSPERVLFLNDSAAAIVAALDGRRSLDSVAAQVGGPIDEVVRFVEALARRRLVVWA